MPYYAHTSGVEKADWQLLSDHLAHSAALAAEFGADAGVSELARVAGLIHDLGKYSLAFQRRLEGARHPVDHSTAGAKEILRLYESTPQGATAEILAYCIAGHHTGLPDGGSPLDMDEDGTLRARLKGNLEDYSAYRSEIDLLGMELPSRVAIRPFGKHMQFSVAFLTRMVYSALVDADFQDTEETMQGKRPRGGYAPIVDLCQKFNRSLEAFGHPQNPIHQKRNQTLQACIDRAAEKPGFFTLTVPTGGGKTLASMAFALNHAVQRGLKRVVYVIPFTSIIEQNAAVFKDRLGAENVLEHHSNFDWEQLRRLEHQLPDDRTVRTSEKLKLAAENWDIPVVVTTNVQFFESLFANRSSCCRKLHNLAKSVIIFDEAQMLPRDFLQPCMAAVWELVTNYGASAVFCTATQPALARFFPAETPITELAQDPQELFDFYRRVRVKTLGKRTDGQLLEQLNAARQVLCIVNTRKHARGLFERLDPTGRYHLSTLMCPAHRKAALLEIRARLKDGLPCRVVSTQVLEAGIDVDFPLGYRALAGLDAIIQAAGRVNRERKAPFGEMFVFEPDSTFVKRIPAYIAQGAAVARSILRDYASDPISIPAIQAYFEQIYAMQDGWRAFDVQEIFACFEKGESLNFKTAAERFRIIGDDMLPVIIPYNPEAIRLIAELRSTSYPISTLRKLQTYTVNIYEKEYQALNEKGAFEIIADEYSVLRTLDYYNPETGLTIPEVSGAEAIFY